MRGAKNIRYFKRRSRCNPRKSESAVLRDFHSLPAAGWEMFINQKSHLTLRPPHSRRLSPCTSDRTSTLLVREAVPPESGVKSDSLCAVQSTSLLYTGPLYFYLRGETRNPEKTHSHTQPITESQSESERERESTQQNMDWIRLALYAWRYRLCLPWHMEKRQDISCKSARITKVNTRLIHLQPIKNEVLIHTFYFHMQEWSFVKWHRLSLSSAANLRSR